MTTFYVFFVVALLFFALVKGLTAFQKPTRRHPLSVKLAIGGLCACLASCTAAQLASVETSLSALQAAAQSPIPCQDLTAVDGTEAGQVCGVASSAVGSLASLINGILKGLPAKSSSTAVVASSKRVCWTVGDSAVYLRTDLAGDVQNSIAANLKTLKK